MRRLVKISFFAIAVFLFFFNVSLNLNGGNANKLSVTTGSKEAIANVPCQWYQDAGMCFCEISGVHCTGVENCSSLSIRCPWE
jgi:YbbR domain-containing protein